MIEHFGVIDQEQFILGFLFIAIIFIIDILCSESARLSYPINKKYHPILLTAIIPAIAIVFSFGYAAESDVNEITLNDTYEYTYKRNNDKGETKTIKDLSGNDIKYKSYNNQDFTVKRVFNKGDTVKIKIIEINGLLNKKKRNFYNARIFIVDTVDDDLLFEVPKSKIEQLGLKPVVEQYYDLEGH